VRNLSRRRRSAPDSSAEDAVRRLAAAHADAGESLETLHGLIDVEFGDRNPDELEWALRTAATAWADTVVTRLNSLECSDPLTGLADVDHLLAYAANPSLFGPDVSSLTAVVIDLTSRKLGEVDSIESPIADDLRLATIDAELEKLGDLAAHRARFGRRRLVFLAASEWVTPDLAMRLTVELTGTLRRSHDGTSANLSTHILSADPQLAAHDLRSIVR
jgi:hypothetical protein